MNSSRISRPAAAVAGFLVVLVALGLVVSDAGHTQASHTGGMDAKSIDLDVTGNTATSLGPLDSCVEAQRGDMLTVDVTATNIPAETAMIAFAYGIEYDESRVWVEAENHQLLLAANIGSALFNLSEPTPDRNLDNIWKTAVIDVSSLEVVSPEYGSGVLSRLTIGVSQGAPSGWYSLNLASAAHIDGINEAYAPDVLNNGIIAIGASCPALPPTPTSTPSATPGPTPTPLTPLLSINFDEAVSIWMPDDSVTIGGRVHCSTPMTVEIQAAVQQFVKGALVVAPTLYTILVACDEDTAWSATMRPVSERFRPGAGEAIVTAYAPGYGGVGSSGPVHLKPGATK